MRFTRSLRDYPLIALSVVAVAFIAWLWRDGVPASPRSLASEPPPAVLPVETTPTFIPPPVVAPTQRDVTLVIARLKPGMARAEVEALVGSPSPDDVHPATVSEGRVTYRLSYAFATLEFDASKPGHPLLGIHDPDPRF